MNINITKAGSFMEIYNNCPDTEKQEVEAVANEYYRTLFSEAVFEKIPNADLPFLINTMKIFLSAMQQICPEEYEKALIMLPEENLQKDMGEIVEEILKEEEYEGK